jgi:hypothetical protein
MKLAALVVGLFIAALAYLPKHPNSANMSTYPNTNDTCLVGTLLWKLAVPSRDSLLSYFGFFILT